jgi:hypothetical protein
VAAVLRLLSQDLAAGTQRLSKDFAAVDELWLTISLGWNMAGAISGGGNMIEIGDPSSGFFCLRWDLPPSAGWFDQCDSGNNSDTPLPVDGGYQFIEMHWKRGTAGGGFTDGLSDLYIDGALVWNGLDFYDTAASRINLHNAFDYTIYVQYVKIGTARGAQDIFFDDFSSCDTAAWDAVIGDPVVVFDPFAGPSPTPTGRVYADLPWRGIVTDINGETITLLDHRATDRSILYTLNGPAYHSGQVASDDVEINRPFPDPNDPAAVTNNRRLVYLFRREPRLAPCGPPYVCRFGGILMNVEDQGADAPTTRYTAFDPWQYLMSRPIRNPNTGALPPLDGLKFNAKDSPRASEIAYSFLVQSELFEGETHIDFSDLSLLPPSSILTNGITFTEGTSVGEAWQQLCDTGTIDIHLDPFYDPNGTPGKVCKLRFVPQANGVAAGPVRYGTIMAWDLPGHSLSAISRMVDGTRLANTIAFFAGEGGVAVGNQTDPASIAAYGQYWAQQFFPDTHDRVKVALLAVAELAIRRNGARSLTFDPTPERTEIPLRDYGLGDFVPAWASRNLREPIGIDYAAFDANDPGGSGYQRIYGIPIDIDDNGVARVRGILTSRDTVTA